MKPISVPNGRVLAAANPHTGANALPSIRDLVGEFSGGTVVCSKRLLIDQLATGLAWSFAKSVALQGQMPAQIQASHRIKAKPIDDLYHSLKLRFANVVSRRTLDLWEQGVLLSCAAKKYIVLVLPDSGGKLVKPTQAELLKVMWHQIWTIADEYGSMDELLRDLRPPPSEKSDGKLLKALNQALSALESADVIPSDCQGVLDALQNSISGALDRLACRDREEHKVFTCNGRSPRRKTIRQKTRDPAVKRRSSQQKHRSGSRPSGGTKGLHIRNRTK